MATESRMEDVECGVLNNYFISLRRDELLEKFGSDQPRLNISSPGLKATIKVNENSRNIAVYCLKALNGDSCSVYGGRCIYLD